MDLMFLTLLRHTAQSEQNQDTGRAAHHLHPPTPSSIIHIKANHRAVRSSEPSGGMSQLMSSWRSSLSAAGEDDLPVRAGALSWVPQQAEEKSAQELHLSLEAFSGWRRSSLFPIIVCV